MNEMRTRYAVQMPQFDWIRKREREAGKRGEAVANIMFIKCTNCHALFCCYLLLLLLVRLSYAIVAVCS